MEIIASHEALEFVRGTGGRLWVWLDPHGGLGSPYIYLMTATEPPGATKATRRLRSARRPHRFRTYPVQDVDILLDAGRLEPPQELHLELKRFPRRRVEAYWNGAIFVGEDIPPPDQW